MHSETVFTLVAKAVGLDTLELYRLYLNNLNNKLTSSIAYGDESRELYATMFYCNDCGDIIRQKSRAKRAAIKKQLGHLKQCNKFPMYFNFKNLSDMDRLSDTVNRPITLVQQQRTGTYKIFYDNRIWYDINMSIPEGNTHYSPLHSSPTLKTADDNYSSSSSNEMSVTHVQNTKVQYPSYDLSGEDYNSDICDIAIPPLTPIVIEYINHKNGFFLAKKHIKANPVYDWTYKTTVPETNEQLPQIFKLDGLHDLLDVLKAHGPENQDDPSLITMNSPSGPPYMYSIYNNNAELWKKHVNTIDTVISTEPIPSTSRETPPPPPQTQSLLNKLFGIYSSEFDHVVSGLLGYNRQLVTVTRKATHLYNRKDSQKNSKNVLNTMKQNGYAILGIHGLKESHETDPPQMHNVFGGLTIHSNIESVNWDKCVVIEISSHGKLFQVLDPSIAKAIPCIIQAQERKSKGSVHLTEWSECLKNMRLEHGKKCPETTYLFNNVDEQEEDMDDSTPANPERPPDYLSDEFVDDNEYFNLTRENDPAAHPVFDNSYPTPEHHKATPVYFSPCHHCSICTRDLWQWNKLTNGSRQQSLQPSKSTLSEYFEIFGFKKELHRLEQCWALSDAVIDIESCTTSKIIPEKMKESSLPGRHFSNIESLAQTKDENHQNIRGNDSITQTPMYSSNRSIKTQEPVLLASLDNLPPGNEKTDFSWWKQNWATIQTKCDLENGGRNDVNLAELKNNDGTQGNIKFFFIHKPEHWRDTLRQYILHEIERFGVMQRLKIKLMEPIIKFLGFMRTIHYLFREKWMAHEIKLDVTEIKKGETDEQTEKKLKRKIRRASKQSWKQSTLGQFATAVENMINSRHIYAHNGSNYDYVLMAGVMCMEYRKLKRENHKTLHENKPFEIPIPPHNQFEQSPYYDAIKFLLKEHKKEQDEFRYALNKKVIDTLARGKHKVARKKHRPKTLKLKRKYMQQPEAYKTWCPPANIRVNRQGTSIVTMSISGFNITWRDSMKLLPGGTSLSKFGKMMGLQENKGHFPFSQLINYEYLLGQNLPHDQSQWASSLSGGKTLDKNTIEQCHTLYRELGAVNRLSYCLYYLVLDCLILLAGMHKLYSLFNTLMHTNPMECNKFTIASFAFDIVQKYLRSQQKIGFFTAQHPVIQAFVQTAMRGGVTGVYATMGGECTPGYINEHLYQAHVNNNIISEQQEQQKKEKKDQEKETIEKNIDGTDDKKQRYYCYARDPDFDTSRGDDDDDEAPGPLKKANTVLGLDIHSLYASSGKRYNIFVFRPLAPARRNAAPPRRTQTPAVRDVAAWRRATLSRAPARDSYLFEGAKEKNAPP